MLKKISFILIRLITIIFSIYIIYLSITDKDNLFKTITDTLSMWLYKVFPPLFTIYFLCSLLLSTKSFSIIFFLIKPLNKLFKFETNNGFNLFIISFFLGTPSIYSILREYKERNLVSINDYSRLLSCTGFISPLFIFSLFKDFSLALIIYSSHILSNILICIFNHKKTDKLIVNQSSIQINSFKQIANFPKIILIICLYMIIANIFICFFSNFNFLNNYLFIFELSTGAITIINKNLPLSLLVILLSFNGICIHLQVNTLLQVKNEYLIYFKFRIISAIISLILFLLMSLLFSHYT